jgi:hypothetical protein
MTAGGIAVLAYNILREQPLHPLQFGALLLIAAVAARFKVKLPGLNSNMSINLPFVLIAAVWLSPLEAMLIAMASTATQCFPQHGGRLKAVHMLFNVSTMAVAVGLGCAVFHRGLHLSGLSSVAASLVPTAVVFFLVQTIPVATIISLTEGGSVLRIWSSIFHLSFPYYLLSAGMTSIVTSASRHIGWQIPLLALPAMYGVHRSYQLYFGRAAAEPHPAGLAKRAAASN